MLTVTINNGANAKVINGPRSKNRITGTLVTGKNLVPTLTFNIYPNNEGYSFIERWSTIVRAHDNDGKSYFGGRVIDYQLYFDSSGAFYKQVTCEGWMGYLNDSISYGYSLLGTTRPRVLQKLLESHNEEVGQEKEIVLAHFDLENTTLDYDEDYFNKSTLEAMLNEEMTSDEEPGRPYTYEVNEAQDGTLELEYFHSLISSDTVIELGKNLESINIQTNFDDLCTRVYPQTKDGNGMENVPAGKLPYVDASASAIERFGIIAKMHKFEKVSKTTKLAKAARRWLNQNEMIKYSFSISSFDLYEMDLTPEPFELYRQYRIKCQPLEIDEFIELTQITRDINDVWKVNLTFGDKGYKLTQFKDKK